MKKLWVIVVLAMLAVSFGAAAGLKDFEPTRNLGKPVFIEKPFRVEVPVQYERIETVSPDPIKAAKQMVGLEDKVEAVSVVYGEDVLAIIPTDSKFVDVPVTEKCLELQYGTDDWYKCEKRFG
jgi:hypothetical protein